MDATPPPPSTSPDISLDALKGIHCLCEDFEAAWRAGRPPRVEGLVEVWSEPARAYLLHELLALEIELRRECGDAPEPAEYHGRFPENAATVSAAFSTLDTVTMSAPGRVCVAPHPQFGDYELIEEIARGGMGVVYKARHLRLNRVVALKMILSGQFASEAERKRFLQEAELAANLDHPNIVPIYEVGAHEGRLYFAMKLVDGGSLAREVARLRADPQATARLLAKVARAIHFAHARGFIHCDLKPSNILLDATGQPHVTDFGLARKLDGDSTLTATGAVLGTPGYMAPEQAAGARREITSAADVYGLGAILYELLTGRPPFRAPTVMETVMLVLEREPSPPRQLDPRVSPELERICLTCLEKSPKDRYASADALADALERYLRGEEIADPSIAQQLRRWTRREPELVARLGALLLIAGFTQYNYLYVTMTPSPWLHYRVQAVLAFWAALSVLYQVVLRRGRWSERARCAWAATDVVALTSVLSMLEAFGTDLVVGYPLLIAASGLWFRVPLVWLTTILAVAGYAWLAFDAAFRPMPPPRPHYTNIFISALFVTGFVVVRQLKRVLAISTYYEKRP